MNDSVLSGPRLVRFGVFELDTHSRELRKAGVRLSLPEQPLQILECLLDNPGELVTRDELRKRLWPGDTFVDFEHGLNAAVKRLRDVLGDSADSPRFVETVPRRGYRFLAPVERWPNGALEQPEPAVAALPHRRPIFWSGAIALTALAAAALAWTLAPPRADVVAERGATRLVQLSTLSGWADWPTFSPDGGQVAFSRSVEGHHGNRSNIYVQLVGSTESRQLMTDETDDFGPSWSPDGRRIAFLRRSSAGSRIHITSPLGGSAVKVSDFLGEAPISWSPDGRFLAVQRAAASTAEQSALWLIPLDGGDPRPLAHVTPPAVNGSPSFSPDGHRLAYASCTNQREGACHVEVISLNSDLSPSASPVRIPGTFFGIAGIAWTADGRSLVFDGGGSGMGSRLLRAPADGSQQPSAMEVGGLRVGAPATTRTRETLAFVRGTFNLDVYRVGVGKPAGVVTSSLNDFQGQFSPDGARIAFCSDRAGDVAIWMSAADGSGAHQLARGPHGAQCSPHWAPDGRSIVFDSQGPDGYWHVWSVDSDGGTPRQITKGAGTQNMPSWSRDGRWIYFSADRGHGRDIWRVDADDGTEQQITRTGAGSLAVESADGLSLLYQPRDDDSPLLSMPLTGGASTELVKCVRGTNFAAISRGIYYAACDGGTDPRVHWLDPATGRDRVLGSLENIAGTPGLSVSPDGRSILYARLTSFSADLMMIENFR